MAHSMAEMAPAPWKSKPSRAPALSMAVPSNTYATKALPWKEGANPTAKKAPYKKHDFGYTIGGPVYIPNHYNADKKKTFFFFSEEWRREKNPHTTGAVNVPSDAERTGNFSDLCPAPGTTFYQDATL